MKHIWVTPLRSTDLSVCQYGKEDCPPFYRYGPAVRDHFLLHFVLSGEGSFTHGGKQYTLSAGDGFLISPHEVAYYEADGVLPWSYAWIGFFTHGSKLMEEIGLTPQNPLFRFEKTEEVLAVFDQMSAIDATKAEGQLRLTGHLYMLLSLLHPEAHTAAPAKSLGMGEDYVENAVRHIRENYGMRLSVSEIAASLGIHRSYLAALFKEHTGMSPREYILWVRVNKAYELLTSSHLSIISIAHSVGYEDPLLFSRIFKKYAGVSPKEYRKAHGAHFDISANEKTEKGDTHSF